MPAGELFINGVDAFTTWGISFTGAALSALMTPPPMKDIIKNTSALQDGSVVVSSGRKYDERTLTLPFNLVASSESDFHTKYANFCSQVLANGRFTVRTKYQYATLYRLDYLSCSNFSEYNRTMGKFSLRVLESNPADRVAPVPPVTI